MITNGAEEDATLIVPFETLVFMDSGLRSAAPE